VTVRPEPTFEESAADRQARRELAAIAAIVGVLAAIIFVGWPSLDLAASRFFYLRPRTFWLTGSEFADTIRTLFTLLTWAAGLAAAAGIVLAIGWRRRLLGLALPQWLFLALVLALGPGLIANALLKDNWARPRPTQVLEFGGNQPFKPVLDRSGQCERNCSFVGGEAASIFALGFAVALLARRRRSELMAATLAAGSFIGLIRLAEGGHFLSDIVFAGVLMGLVVALLHWLVFDLLRGRLGDETVWHDRAVDIAGHLAASSGRLKREAEAWLDRRRSGRDGRNDHDDDVGR
jgi:lipid A 4'-phosphatase